MKETLNNASAVAIWNLPAIKKKKRKSFLETLSIVSDISFGLMSNSSSAKVSGLQIILVTVGKIV